jgi:hypothetical protein
MMNGLYPRGSFVAGIPSQRKNFTVGAVALAANDPVNLVGGLAVIADAGDFLMGAIVAAAAASATGTFDVTPYGTYLVDNDNDSTTFASTHVGYRFDLDGTGTGSEQVDTSTADLTEGGEDGTLVCLEYNPQVHPYEADTSIGLFMIAQHQLYGCN